MRVRTLKTILAVSVAVNVFALAGAGAYAVSRAQVERKVDAQRGPGRHEAFAEVLAGLDPATRDGARQQMRRSALAAKPDFEAARNARREAIDVAGRPTLDEPRVRTVATAGELPAAVAALARAARSGGFRNDC